MISYSYKYLTLADVCEYNKLDYTTVMDAISNSDTSFGTNYDTLITSTQLERILENADVAIDGLDFNNHDEDSGYILISLGS
jgi:hypothetical protein